MRSLVLEIKIRFAPKTERCLVCVSEKIRHAFSLVTGGERIDWDACSDCELVFQNPRLDPATLKSIYSEKSYWGQGKNSPLTAYSDYLAGEPIRLKQGLRRLKKIIQRTGLRQGKVLDVGCATGSFTYLSQQHGFTATGVDPSPMMTEYGRKHYGIEIHCNSLEEYPLEKDSYDLITLWGTDSHFFDPKASFGKLAASLKEKGILAMNYQNFRHWIRFFLPGIKSGWNTVYNLSPRSIRALFQLVELEILYERTEWQSSTLDHVLRVARLPSLTFLRKQEVFLPAISFPLVLATRRIP
jgi:SAM-dependent methyltransferase